MIGIARAARVHARRCDAGNLTQKPGEVGSVGVAGARLFLKARHLCGQQCCLEFRQAQVRADSAVGKVVPSILPAAAVVVDPITLLDQLIVFGEYRATLTGVEVLARLKTKAPRFSVSADL